MLYKSCRVKTSDHKKISGAEKNHLFFLILRLHFLVGFFYLNIYKSRSYEDFSDICKVQNPFAPPEDFWNVVFVVKNSIYVGIYLIFL